MIESKTKKLSSADPLEQALADWRATERRPARFTGPARERILDSIQAREWRFERPTALRPVFFPLRRFALAAAVPVLVLVLAMGYVLLPGNQVESVLQVQTTRMEVFRQGDDVVFRIANGTKTHRVYKASEIKGLADARPVLVSDGVYRDGVDAEAALVFYRID